MVNNVSISNVYTHSVQASGTVKMSYVRNKMKQLCAFFKLALLKGLPPSQTKAIMDLFERHIVANSSHMSGPSRASKWIVWIFLLPCM